MNAAKVGRQKWPDRLKISMRINGELVEVGQRYRGQDGKLCVAWTVPFSKIKNEIVYLERAGQRS